MSSERVTYFPLLFGCIWIFVAAVTAFFSGWFALTSRYPDRAETALLKLTGKSGRMGTANLSGMLTLSVCQSGLRVGVLRFIGLFQRNFFVPWEEVNVTRRKKFSFDMAELTFGSPKVGGLTITGALADRLARGAPDVWPENPLPSPPERRAIVAAIFRMWLLRTGLAAAFFTVVPRLTGPQAPVPLGVSIGFPAAMFALVALIEYARADF